MVPDDKEVFIETTCDKNTPSLTKLSWPLRLIEDVDPEQRTEQLRSILELEKWKRRVEIVPSGVHFTSCVMFWHST